MPGSIKIRYIKTVFNDAFIYLVYKVFATDERVKGRIRSAGEVTVTEET